MSIQSAEKLEPDFKVTDIGLAGLGTQRNCHCGNRDAWPHVPTRKIWD